MRNAHPACAGCAALGASLVGVQGDILRCLRRNHRAHRTATTPLGYDGQYTSADTGVVPWWHTWTIPNDPPHGCPH